MKTGVFHPGRQHSWQVAAALAEADALAWYATAIYFDERKWPYAALAKLSDPMSRRLLAGLRRRSAADIPLPSLRRLPAAEWLELGLARLGQRNAAHVVNRFGNDVFQRAVNRLIGREPVDRVWGFDTSSRRVLKRAKSDCVVGVLDQTAGHAGTVRKILLAQRDLHPEFFRSGLSVPSAWAVREADEEVAAAAHVVVGAAHGRDSAITAGKAADKVHVLPYGYDETRFPVEPVYRSDLGTLPVRFLFVGAVGPRKGVHLLLKAFQGISPSQARLRLVGPLTMPAQLLRDAGEGVEYVPPLSHDRIAAEYAGAHCFVFPTLIDGGGIVLYEAAASGLGIIQSAMCGDGVRSGRLGPNGIVLRENSVEGWRAAIEGVIANPGILRDWSASSWAMRRERSWTAYRRRLIELLPVLV